MYKKSIIHILIGICCIALIIVLYHITNIYDGDSGRIHPWYGRGNNLPDLPYTIVVGPVDASNGIKGFLEPGMTKSEIHKSLGKPLVRALSDEEAMKMIERGPSDSDTGSSLGISSFKSEFYGGVFAWVLYNRKGQVSLIYFDPGAFKKRLRGTQKIIVFSNGHSFMIDENTRQASLILLIKKSKLNVDSDVNWSNSLVLRGTNMRFVFDSKSSKLKYVSIEDEETVLTRKRLYNEMIKYKHK